MRCGGAPRVKGLLDESSGPSECLPPPITQLLDSRIDQPRGGVSFPSFGPLFLFFMVVVAFSMLLSLACHLRFPDLLGST